MSQPSAAQQQVLTLLRELLSQRGNQTPCIELERYQFALRSLIYACPRTKEGYCTANAYYVLVEAMHLIYHRKETAPDLWLCQVEEVTYDAFLRLQKL